MYTDIWFLAERCNCIAKFRYSHKMLSVVCLFVVCLSVCHASVYMYVYIVTIVTKQLQIRSRGFHCKAVNCLIC